MQNRQTNSSQPLFFLYYMETAEIVTPSTRKDFSLIGGNASLNGISFFHNPALDATRGTGEGFLLGER